MPRYVAFLCGVSPVISDPDRHVQFVAYTPARLAVGFVEASLHSEYVNGTNSSPVAFLEGIYVAAEHRRQGIAAQLVGAAAAWATSLGCQEFSLDAPLENELSQKVHKALGFLETERVVFFRKALR